MALGGLDVGNSGCKFVAFLEDGEVIFRPGQIMRKRERLASGRSIRRRSGRRCWRCCAGPAGNAASP